MPFTSAHLSPWKLYQRNPDAVQVKARLVERMGEKLMQVEEKVSEEVRCPECRFLLEQKNDQKTKTYLLTTQIFHQRHRLIDKP